MPPEVETINLPLMSRALPVVPETVDEAAREVDVIFTTGAQVRRRDWRAGEDYLEELVVSAEAIDLGRLNNGAPCLDTHYSYSVDEVVAAVVPGSARVEAGKGVCRVKFPPAGVDARSDSAWGKVSAGVLRNISVGYRIIEFVEIRNGADTPIRRVTRWEPMEISLVPMGADDGAVVRSADDKRGERREFAATFKRSGEKTMTKPNEGAGSEGEGAARNVPAETEEQRAAALTAARKEGGEAERAAISEILDLAKIAGRSLDDVRAWFKGGKSVSEVRSAIADDDAGKSERTASRSSNASETGSGGADSMAESMRKLIEANGLKPRG